MIFAPWLSPLCPEFGGLRGFVETVSSLTWGFVAKGTVSVEICSGEKRLTGPGR